MDINSEVIVDDADPSELVTWETIDTEYSACSVECYKTTDGRCIVATGTYQVTKVTGQEEVESPLTERLGRIYLHSLDIVDEKVVTSEVTRLSCPAVLDMKWSPEGSELAVVDAAGNCSLLRATLDLELNRQSECLVSDGGLALALDWDMTGDNIAVSDSKGQIHTVKVTQSELEIDLSFSSHQFEAWTTCFSRHDNNILFSGGDDCCFYMYDVRVNTSSHVGKNSKSHTMGVTTMLSSQVNQHQMWTGSYDEQVRCWDCRNIRQPVSSVGVGGGVWRIKQRGDILLVAGMHAGFRLIKDNKVIVEYDEHESLAYGADWVPGLHLESYNSIATCSFYDHILKIWSVPSSRLS